jgi:hypothetical protein
MSRKQLGQFTEEFLKYHGLPDYQLVFEPRSARSPRRSKRATTFVEAGDVTNRPKPVTAEDLLVKYLNLIPEAKKWLEGPKRFSLRFYDDAAKPVDPSDTMDELRGRPGIRVAADRERAAKILRTAVRSCARLGIDAKTLGQIAKETIAELGAR